jgi:hypothetical protein
MLPNFLKQTKTRLKLLEIQISQSTNVKQNPTEFHHFGLINYLLMISTHGASVLKFFLGLISDLDVTKLSKTSSSSITSNLGKPGK